MNYSSSLANDLTSLVLDTSVLINLHASRHGGRILDSLPNEILVPGIVVAEFQRDTSRAQGQHQFIQELIAARKVRVATLSEAEYQVFDRLASGSPSLGDGEAATIAVATHRLLLPVIDDQRGRLQAQASCPGKRPAWSLDFFRHPAVVADLGTACASDALYLALRDGRMRIHEDHCDFVVRIIGVQQALECTSLPKYRERRDLWKTEVDNRLSAVSLEA